MDTKHLKTFLTFAELGSFNKASRKLNYSTSSLSSHIKSLEAEFGVELVHNRGRKSTLTKAGEALLPYARSILSECQNATQAMNEYGSSSIKLDIMLSEMVGKSRLSHFYPEFSNDYPNMKINISIGSTSNLKKMLNAGNTDVIFLQDFVKNKDSAIASVPICDEQIVLIAPPSHPLAKKERIDGNDLRFQSVLFARRDYLEKTELKAYLTDCHVDIDEMLFLESGSLLLQTIKTRSCLSFVPYSSAAWDIETGSLIRLPWCGPKAYMTVYAMYAEDSMQKEAIEDLIAYIKERA